MGEREGEGEGKRGGGGGEIARKANQVGGGPAHEVGRPPDTVTPGTSLSFSQFQFPRVDPNIISRNL